jgi:CheY-like chemotaxis protein
LGRWLIYITTHTQERHRRGVGFGSLSSQLERPRKDFGRTVRRRSSKSDPEGTILIVNDEPDFSYALIEILRKDGFEVQSASSCEEAQRIIQDVSPELLLVDLSITGDCALALIRALRNISDWAKTPIVVTSARTSPEDRSATLEAGADVFLPKPFSLREFRAAIRQVVPLPATRPLNPARLPHTA